MSKRVTTKEASLFAEALNDLCNQYGVKLKLDPFIGSICVTPSTQEVEYQICFNSHTVKKHYILVDMERVKKEQLRANREGH